MNNSRFLTNSIAVNEVIAGILLVLIAIVVFTLIYAKVIPVPFPPHEPNIHLMGYVTEEGEAVIEHMGGETLDSYEVHVSQSNEINIYTYRDDPWEIGGCYYPPIDSELFTEDGEVGITVYGIYGDGSKQVVFEGVLTQTEQEEEIPPPDNPMLISTLRTNSIDEDLICYNDSINPSIDASTYIYNWLVKSGIDFKSLTSLLMPFDTESASITRDYSSNNNGTVYGATWNSNGKVGGAYSFDGDDYISIPYCFDSNYLDKLTVEAWIKTSLSSGTILSFNRNKYWELAISDGLVKWSTNASDGIADIDGNTGVSDDMWHHVAATYDSSTGDCNIYIDGILDVNENAHEPGELLGSGDTPTGVSGKGTGSVERETIFSTSFETQNEKEEWSEHNKTEEGEETWDNLRYDDFNFGWGSYTDGGGDCARTTDYKHEGSHSAWIQDNSGTSSSFYLTDVIDVDTPEYTSIKIDFWWMWNDYWSWGNPGWETNEDWWVRFSDDGGNSWENVLDMNYPSGYSEDTWYHQIIYINETEYTFSNNIKIRFQCDAESDNERVFIDQVYINATGGVGRIDCDFDLRDSEELDPNTGYYSIGGTGDFDPEYAAFNRTAIDISGYTDVKVSVWYSYKDTEEDDFLGLYYLDNEEWTPIFEVESPQIGSGQVEWTNVEAEIPDYIDDLVFQFKWMTSSESEYVAIDDLQITGFPPAGENNFTGLIDELKIYNGVLSAEQIYQNYLCTKDGESSKSVIVSEETNLLETWKCIVTPNDGVQDDEPTESNVLTIIIYGGGD